ATLVTPGEEPEELEVDQPTVEKLKHLATYLTQRKKEAPVVRLIGQSEPALRGAAETFCLAFRRSMLFVELAQIADEPRLAKLLRDSQLWQAVLVVQSAELVAQEADAPHVRQLETLLWNRLRDFKEPVLLLGPRGAFLQVPQELSVWRVEVDSL